MGLEQIQAGQNTTEDAAGTNSSWTSSGSNRWSWNIMVILITCIANKVVRATSEKLYFQLLFLLMNSKRLPSWKTEFMNAEVQKISKSATEKIQMGKMREKSELYTEKKTVSAPLTTTQIQPDLQ